MSKVRRLSSAATAQARARQEKRRIEQAAEHIAAELKHHGSLRYPCDDEHKDTARTAGRRAGRLLNRPVRTHADEHTVFVWIADWGTNPLESHRDKARCRHLSEKLFPAPPAPGQDNE